MTSQPDARIGLIMLDAGRRTLIAAIIVTALWALFYWATATPGGP